MMKKIIRKPSFIVTLAMLLCLSFSGLSTQKTAAADVTESSETEAVTEENETTAEPVAVQTDEFLSQLSGENGTTYTNLFSIILDDDYRSMWRDYCAAVCGDDMADMMTDGLQGAISSELYGQAAVDFFSDNEGYAFDCFYINGAESFTHNGNDITIKHTDGTEETHTYEYLGEYNIGEGETMNYMGMDIDIAFPCRVYKSTDEAGEFSYFFFREDTMDTTYHTEFRYGSSLDELKGYLVGEYAYWLAAGFDANADEETVKNVIELFCLENLDYSERSETSLAQISDLVGTWDADLAPFGEAYDGVELYIEIDENGHGMTYMNGENTADFFAYMYDNGEKEDGSYVYVAYSNTENEPEAANSCTLTENENGQLVWTLSSDEGVISYIKR